MLHCEEQNSIVCFLWNEEGSRRYWPEHVNRLANLLYKYMSIPYRFICVTDETEGFNDKVELFQLPKEAQWIKEVKTLEKPTMPSSYRRLWLFSKEAKCLGDRILLLDIDVMIVNDLAPLFSMSNDFVGWRPKSEQRAKIRPINGSYRIGGGTWLLRTGTHTHIWENFSEEGQKKAREVGWRGSDQAWLSYNLAKDCAVFPDEMGIYHSQDGAKMWEELPEDARIIHFNGKIKPWSKNATSRKWLCDYFNNVEREDVSYLRYSEIKRFVSTNKDLLEPEHHIVACFWGTKFDERYPEKLFNAIKRNTTRKCSFWCLNDKYSKAIRKGDVSYIPMPYIEKLGNLNKIYAYEFSNDFLYNKRIFLFDLDTLVIDNIDPILDYSGPFCMRGAINNNTKPGGDLISFVGGWGDS